MQERFRGWIRRNPLARAYIYFREGKLLRSSSAYRETVRRHSLELSKSPSRTEVINMLLSHLDRKTTYLEIGVRNPDDNFRHVAATTRYSVDPGLEYSENPVDFQMTSDAFFSALDTGEVLSPGIRFDVIFIDGLHLAEQTDRDIEHAFRYLTEDGFIVLHDCSPPSEWHAREEFAFHSTPAGKAWNGTTWKAFMKWRTRKDVFSCCIDADFGIGILSKGHRIGNPLDASNAFFEYHILEQNRKSHLNLISFDDLKAALKAGSRT